MNEWFLFMLASLATYRLARLITDDKITESLRRLIIRNAPPVAKKKAEQGIRCPHCVGFHVSTAVVIYLYAYTHWISGPQAFLWQPAIWGAAALLNQLFVKLSH